MALQDLIIGLVRMNELQEINIDTIRSLNPNQRWSALSGYHAWVSRARKQDKKNLCNINARIRKVLRKVNPILTRKCISIDDYALDYCAYISKDDYISEHFYLNWR